MKFKKHAVRIIAAFIIFLCVTVSTAFAQPVPGFSKTAPLSGTGTAANPLKINVCASGSGYVSDGTSMVCSPISGGGVSGTGTVNTVAKWSSTSAVGNSLLTDNATTLSYNAGKFTVDSATGNTAVLGTLTENTRRVFSAVGTGLARDATNAYQVNLAMTAQSCSVGQALTSATAVGVFACGSAVASVAAGTGISVGTSSGIATVTLNMTAQTCGAGTLLSSASAVGVFACSSAITSVSAPLSSASGVATLALCSANQVLQMNAGATAWACAATVTGTVTGTGTSGTSTRWTGTSAIGNGALSDNGTQLGLGVAASTTYQLQSTKALAAANGTGIKFAVTGGALTGKNVALEVSASGGSNASDYAIDATSGHVNIATGYTYRINGSLASAIVCTTSGNVPTWNGSAWTCLTPYGGYIGAANRLTKTDSGASGPTDSLLSDNATTLSYNSGKFTVDSATGNGAFAGTLTFLPGVTTSTATGAVNDLALATGITTVKFTGAGSVNLRGMIRSGGNVDGDCVTIMNATTGTNTVAYEHENTSTELTATNRLSMSGLNDWISANGAITHLCYVGGTINRWYADKDWRFMQVFSSGFIQANGNITGANLLASGAVTATTFVQTGNGIGRGMYVGLNSDAYMTSLSSVGTLNFSYSTNAAATGYISSVGYQEGTTQPRSLEIDDGQGSGAAHAVATFGAAGGVGIGQKTGATAGVTIGSSTNPINLSGVTTVNLDAKLASSVRLLVKGNTPTTSTCGTGATITGDNTAMLLTLGTGTVSPCVVTFPVTFTNEPVCTVETESSTKTFSYSKTATALTLTSGTVSAKYDIICVGIY